MNTVFSLTIFWLLLLKAFKTDSCFCVQNVNQHFISPQGVFPSGLDSVRGTRHHGLVERVHRDRNRINSPHRRPIDKHGRQISFKFTAVKTFVEGNSDL